MHSDVPASPSESKRLLFVTAADDDDDSRWLLDVRARLISGESLREQVPPNWNQDMEVTRTQLLLDESFFYFKCRMNLNLCLSLSEVSSVDSAWNK